MPGRPPSRPQKVRHATPDTATCDTSSTYADDAPKQCMVPKRELNPRMRFPYYLKGVARLSGQRCRPMGFQFSHRATIKCVLRPYCSHLHGELGGQRCRPMGVASLRCATLWSLCPTLKSAVCIFGIVHIISARPCLIEHITHMHSSRYGTAVGCPRASSARNHLCASTLLSPSAVPAKWWYSTHTFVFAAPVYPQACQLSPRDARC